MKRALPDKTGKAGRALELFEKGISTAAIAERLGTTARSVAVMIVHARKQRERKAKESAE